MFSYIGGKSKIGKWIKDYIPHDIETYVEPFSGAFWVYFNLELKNYPNLKKVVYNDKNILNSNLFACIKQYEKFSEYLNKQECQEKRDDGTETDPKFKEMFEKYQEEVFSKEIILNNNNPDFDAALKYIYVVTQVFSGSKPETSKFIDLKGKYHSKFNSFRKKINLNNHGKKLENHYNNLTNVESLDFEDVIKKYDSPTSYFYLDPPYFTFEKYYSKHDFGQESHERLANVLKKTQGRWSLSYYYFSLLEEWFPKDEYRWETKEFNKAAGAIKGKEQTKGEEILIMNYG